MANKTYVIDYTVLAINGSILKQNGTIKAKNRCNALEAQTKLEDFLKKKYPDFGKLIVLSCKEESIFGDIFGGNTSSNPFGDIFGKK